MQTALLFSQDSTVGFYRPQNPNVSAQTLHSDWWASRHRGYKFGISFIAEHIVFFQLSAFHDCGFQPPVVSLPAPENTLIRPGQNARSCMIYGTADFSADRRYTDALIFPLYSR